MLLFYLFLLIRCTLSSKSFEGDMRLTFDQAVRFRGETFAKMHQELWESDKTEHRRLGGASEFLWRLYYDDSDQKYKIPFEFPDAWAGMTNTITEPQVQFVLEVMEEIQNEINKI